MTLGVTVMGRHQVPPAPTLWGRDRAATGPPTVVGTGPPLGGPTRSARRLVAVGRGKFAAGCAQGPSFYEGSRLGLVRGAPRAASTSANEGSAAELPAPPELSGRSRREPPPETPWHRARDGPHSPASEQRAAADGLFIRLGSRFVWFPMAGLFAAQDSGMRPRHWTGFISPSLGRRRAGIVPTLLLPPSYSSTIADRVL